MIVPLILLSWLLFIVCVSVCVRTYMCVCLLHCRRSTVQSRSSGIQCPLKIPTPAWSSFPPDLMASSAYWMTRPACPRWTHTNTLHKQSIPNIKWEIIITGKFPFFTSFALQFSKSVCTKMCFVCAQYSQCAHSAHNIRKKKRFFIGCNTVLLPQDKFKFKCITTF